MKGISKCLICGKEFSWKRSKKQGAAKYCSNFCSNKYKHLLGNAGRFKWAEATYKEKLEKIRENFENMVIKNKEGCWDWKGSFASRGYGKITAFSPKRQITHHRASWLLHVGEIPKGMFVLHKCDNKRCCRPSHLYLGSHKKNMKDMTERNKQALGEKHGCAKLTEENVKEIKKQLLYGLSGVDIAKKYNVSSTAIYWIKNNKTWKHITLEE